MTYKEALDAIASLAPRGWRLGLDRMQAFARAAGLEGGLGEGKPKFIHVAGTNGKGSVASYCQHILHASGHSTGAYFSPYVLDPRERWQLGVDMIAPGELASLTEELWEVAEQFTESEFGGITEFEFKTALGFLYWKRHACDWVALEVGLGGRLDATNVVSPACSVIVSIGLDHTNILGTTEGEIAGEKAGIVKPGVPLILGEVGPDARSRILGIATEVGAPVWEFGKEVLLTCTGEGFGVQTPLGSVEGLHPSIVGAAQPHNMALAVAACQASRAASDAVAIRKGVASAALPGRFQRIKVGDSTWILDGAHNREAAIVLAQTLRQQEMRESTLLTGMVSGHDPRGFYEVLAPFVRRAIVVPIDSPRALAPAELASILRALDIEVEVFDRLAEGVEAARGQGEVLVTGSFYLLGEIGAILMPSKA